MWQKQLQQLQQQLAAGDGNRALPGVTLPPAAVARPDPPCCSAPPVQPSKDDPVMLQCTAPGGGPWATCALQLCEEQGPTRRRRLAGDGGCTPIDVSCAFVAGAASCDVTGKVKQGTPYAIQSTAVKADGTRKSTTGPQGSYTLPYFP